MSDDNKDNTFTYIGDPNDDFSGPTEIEIFGLVFKKDKPALVEDAGVARKLTGHSHFINANEERPGGTRREADELVTMNKEELKATAEAESVEFPSNATKGDLIELIRAAREND